MSRIVALVVIYSALIASVCQVILASIDIFKAVTCRDKVNRKSGSIGSSEIKLALACAIIAYTVSCLEFP